MRILGVVWLLALCLSPVFAQSVASQRAAELGLGMNLSYLEQYWNGTKARHFSDFVKPAELARRKTELAAMARAGFQTVRLPVTFGAWASVNAPYRWDAPDGLAAPDSLVRWALDNNLRVVIDLHHVEFDGSVPGADSTARLVWLWQQIATRYRNTDPERVMFELRNEPHNMTGAAWRAQATQLIQTVRAIVPEHTLIVGFHDWNSRAAMQQSEPFADPNIIYTFHFYDPFVFTHQGATWSSDGLPDLKGVPFPANPAGSLTVPAAAKGTWIENALNKYPAEATYAALYNSLAAAKNWSVAKQVPIFLGEFGSYNLRADPDSRCRHAEAIYLALGKLQIPSAWWEWDGGFSMFGANSRQLMPCMEQALETYATGQLRVLGTAPGQGEALQVYPNPTYDTIRVVSGGATPAAVLLTDANGRRVLSSPLHQGQVSIGTVPAGTYLLTVYDRNGTVLGTHRLLKP